MHGLTLLFVALALGGAMVRQWLLGRQVDAVRAHRDSVPTPFAQTINLADHQRAADFTVAHARLTSVDIVVGTVVLLALTVGGGIDAIDKLWDKADWSSVWRGAAVIASVVVLMSVVDLPLSVWRTFRIEGRFGFNRTTPALFVADMAKGVLLGVVLGGPLLLAILWLMEHAGAAWWIVAWGVWVAFTLLVSWAWPSFLAPLFNKFEPLADEELRNRVETLLVRCGFKAKGVFVMDGSRRSSHGNAYFTGLGRNKRIVFFDTLVERLKHEEIEAVLAHELGHFRLHHVRKRLLLSLAMSFAGLAILGQLATWPTFFHALGLTTPSNHAALLLFMLATPVVTFFLTPLGAWWSRRHEFEADHFASTQAAPLELVEALVKLYRDNASTLTPDPVYAAFYYSHPPALARIGRLKALAGVQQ
ncbi:MAG: M48 family metallopeptidase [Steroidobacteraceae bacterium]